MAQSPPVAGHTPIAIIGMSCLFPKAQSLKEYWANICNRVDAITAIPESHWRITDYFDADPKRPDFTYAHRGGFLGPVPFDPTEFGIAPKALEATDTSQLISLVVAQGALADAGYPKGPGDSREREFDRDRVSVILGVTGTLELVVPLGARLGHPHWRRALKEAGVNDATAEEVVQRIADSYVNWQEESFPGLLGNVVAGRIANRLDLGGTNCVVDAACASSLSAAHMATMELESGRADLVITGGVDTFNDIFMYMCFSKTPALSPTGDARPFAANADGTILGEGIGMIVLKRLAEAERDGDRIYAVLKGIGTASDGRGKAIHTPSAHGQMKALRAAYEQAQVAPATVELVEAHGTGTKVGDATEVAALREVYAGPGRAGTWCALGSVKSQIGHTKAAAGVAALIKAALALQHKVLPPTIKVDAVNPAVSEGPFYVNTQKRPWLPSADHPRRAAVSAFGFGGSNFHAVLEEHDAQKKEVDWDGSVEIVALSAPANDALQTKLGEFAAITDWSELTRAAALSRRQFASAAACRLVFVIARDQTDWRDRCAKLAARLAQARAESSWGFESAYFSAHEPGKLGVLFPGQGAQYVGMGLDLACHFPQMQDTLAAANEASGERFGRRLSDLIFPPPPLNPEAKKANELALQGTAVAQPALGAISLGALRVLESFGVRPSVVAGHSYGELVALCAAGRIDETALHGLSRLRGELMSGGEGDRGGMLAVKTSREEVEPVLAAENLSLVLANQNAPKQIVLSGDTAQIQRAAEAFQHRKVAATVLSVAAAFHSPLVADAVVPLRAALDQIEFAPTAIPIFSNTTGEVYPEDPVAARALLANQLAHPVAFVDEIENMYASGVRTFLEVGPGARLTGLVKSILGEREHVAHALDASYGRHSGWLDLASTLAQLAALGHAVDLLRWQNGEAELAIDKKPQRMTVNLTGANYRAPAPNGSKSTKPLSISTIPTTPTPAPATTVAPRTPAPLTASGGGRSSSPPPASTPSTLGNPALLEALRATQEGLSALQKLQEQTAQLHRQFLEGQELAQHNLCKLIEQQQRLFEQASGLTPTRPIPPMTTAPVRPLPERPVTVPATESVSVNGSAPGTASPRVEELLLEIVSEKTGYPVEMLSLDMDMESDLGIDSIKRVEIMSEAQLRLPDSPVVQPEQLGEFRTLRHVMNFLSPGLALAVATAKIALAPASTNGHPSGSAPSPSYAGVLLGIVSEKTGYPVEMLNLDMDMESDLGIDSIKRVEIMSEVQARLPHAPVVQPDQLGEFRTLAQVIGFLSGGPPPPQQAEVAIPATNVTPPIAHSPSIDDGAPPTRLSRRVLTVTPLSAGSRNHLVLPPGAEVWITVDEGGVAAGLAGLLATQGMKPRLISGRRFPKLKQQADLAGLIIIASARPRAGQELWSSDSERFLKTAFELTRYAGPKLRACAAKNSALFATVSRLDGAFGLECWEREFDPVQGGLAGLCKTVRHEWPEVACKAVDLASAFTEASAAAQSLFDELLLTGPIEVGIAKHGLCRLEEIEAPALGCAPACVLAPGEVVVVTGGARGVTAETAVALAQSLRPTLVLLGRTPLSRDEPEWLRGLEEEGAIKRAMLAQANGNGMTPARIDEEFRRLLANREIARNLERIAATGARVIYRAVDVRDEIAMRAILEEVRAEYGPLRGLLHGAGVLADRLIGDKTDEQFANVFDTKIRGLRALLNCLEGDELKCLVLFSSVTARYGRAGQVDYAMANEALNKIARQQAALRTDCRVVAINWGPWRGGMVNAALGKLFQAQGVDLIPPEAGAQALVAELDADDRAVEVIIGGRMTAGPEGRSSTHPTASSQVATLALSDSANMSKFTLAFERELETGQYPFLESHRLNHAPVLPAAMMVEWMAHGALHENPGFVFHGMDNFRVLKGVVLGADSYPISVWSAKAAVRGATAPVTVELRGGTSPEVVHARAEVVLANHLPKATNGFQSPRVPQSYSRSVAEAYRDVLFHGPHFQCIERIEGCSDEGIVARVATAPPPAAWMTAPLRSSWLADPLAVDAAFQLMILWTYEHHGEVSLPTYLKSYRQYRSTFPREGVRAVVHAAKNGGNLARADIEFIADDGNLVARMEGYECVMAASLIEAFQH